MASKKGKTKKNARARKPAARRREPAPAAQPAKTGRPSKFTTAIFEEIIESVSSGTPLAEVCRRDHMPGLRTVYDWMDRDGDLSARFARAREVGFDMIALEALRIADTPMMGRRRKTTQGSGDDDEEELTEVVTEDMLGHRKLQVETRLKLLAKWDPKRYGDLLRLDGKVDGDHMVRIVNMTGKKIGGGRGDD